MDIKLIIFIAVVLVMLAYGYLNPEKCPKCKSKLKLDRIDSPWGINITKKLILTFRKYSDFDEYYGCPCCGKKYLRKRDSRGELEEI